ECADCRVPLTREPPAESQSHQRNADTDRDEGVAYDLDGWTVEQRTLLEFILNGDRIAYLFDDNLLVVPHAQQAKVEEIIDSIEGEPIDDK
ncbi:MAG: hypothetical protein QOI55_921, partial [Actinomycetota bacterium]|nr:hypothetical protein [Actinomycetota bacterium]